jgi:hypothetical protein
MSTLSGPSNKAFKKVGTVAEARATGFKGLDDDPETNAKQRYWPSNENQDDQPKKGIENSANMATHCELFVR